MKIHWDDFLIKAKEIKIKVTKKMRTTSLHSRIGSQESYIRLMSELIKNQNYRIFLKEKPPNRYVLRWKKMQLGKNLKT